MVACIAVVSWPTIEAETAFMGPMGADTLGWFQFGQQRLSARLPPRQARAISGRVRLALAPPLGVGLYGSCLIGGVTLEETEWTVLKYSGLLLLGLLLIAFIPRITTLLPRLAGY